MKTQIDVQETQKEMKSKFEDVMASVETLIKKIEAFKEIGEDWEIGEDKEENNKIMNLGKNLDCGINFALRQLLVRYGNLLFIG